MGGSMRVVILFSGGMDSSLLAQIAAERVEDVALLFVDYGQPHVHAERKAARQVAGDLGLFGVYREAVASLAGGFVGLDRAGAKVVPARNAALLALATNYAAAHGAEEVWIGACAADAKDFHDCRSEFIDAWNFTMRASGVPVVAKAPLVMATKAEIRHRLGVTLGATWSCYHPKEDLKPCGECGACHARRA
jgi:7-cyano-7-deazaguanine synthase